MALSMNLALWKHLCRSTNSAAHRPNQTIWRWNKQWLEFNLKLRLRKHWLNVKAVSESISNSALLLVWMVWILSPSAPVDSAVVFGDHRCVFLPRCLTLPHLSRFSAQRQHGASGCLKSGLLNVLQPLRATCRNDLGKFGPRDLIMENNTHITQRMSDLHC